MTGSDQSQWTPASAVTRILSALQEGDPRDAEQLLPLVTAAVARTGAESRTRNAESDNRVESRAIGSLA
jgi:hypothetical protein